MSGKIFPISANKSDYCFNPFTCATDQGHIVVWAYGVDSEQTTLWARVYGGVLVNPEDSQTAVKVGTMSEHDHVLFLRRFKKSYILAVETTTGTSIYFLDENANVYDQYLYKNKDILIHCHATDTDTVLFTYNHDDNTFNVGTVHSEDWGEHYTLHTTYTDVYGIPQVFVKGNQYTAGWITTTDTLQVVNNSITADTDGHLITLESYDVDYLMATEVDKDTVVYSGYNTQTQTLRMDFFTVEGGEHICSRYWKSKEYKNMTFSLATLNRGFMLLADGPDDIQVCGQRFTHLGSWLYPMLELVSSEEPTWSPDLARGTDQTLLVYIVDYDDHSEVWGKWLDVGEIPELDKLTLANLED